MFGKMFIPSTKTHLIGRGSWRLVVRSNSFGFVILETQANKNAHTLLFANVVHHYSLFASCFWLHSTKHNPRTTKKIEHQSTIPNNNKKTRKNCVVSM